MNETNTPVRALRTLHIEGLDLAGKSTVCRVLRDRWGAEMRVNSILPPGANAIHAEAERLRKADALPAAPLGGLYYAAMMRDIELYKPPSGPVVQDSSLILRSIAFHSVFGDPALADAFRAWLPRHPRFGATVVIRASDEVRRKRLEGRCSRHNDNPEDFLIVRDPAGFHCMEDILMETAEREFGATVVDTSFLERDGEKARIADLLLSKMPSNNEQRTANCFDLPV